MIRASCIFSHLCIILTRDMMTGFFLGRATQPMQAHKPIQMVRLTSVQSTVIIYFFPAMSVNFIIGQSHLSPAKLLPARHFYEKKSH